MKIKWVSIVVLVVAMTFFNSPQFNLLGHPTAVTGGQGVTGQDSPFKGCVKVSAYFRNVSYQTNHNNSMGTVFADTEFLDTTGSEIFKFVNDVTFDYLSSGLGGVETSGMVNQNSWYALIGIGDSTGVKNPNVVLVEESKWDGTNDNWNLPNGFDKFARLGWVKTQVTPEFEGGRYSDGYFSYNAASDILVTGNGSYSNYSFSHVVPPTARLTNARLSNMVPIPVTLTYIYGTTSGGGMVFYHSDGIDDPDVVPLHLDTQQKIEIKADTSGLSSLVSMRCLGYWDNLEKSAP